MTASWFSPPLPARVAASRHLPLVGRRVELETLESLWSEVEQARRQLVLIGGEPGAGKSRLMAEVAGALHDSGATVLVGTCSADGGVPYQPFSEILNHVFASIPESTIAIVGAWGAGLVAVPQSFATPDS